MSRNVLRLAIVVWLAISVYSGLTSWTHHDVPVVRTVPVTEQNASGAETVLRDYECPAVVGGSGAPRLTEDVPAIVGPSEQPCKRFVDGRRLLFWLDVVAGVAALALTFVHLPRRLLDRGNAAERTTGRPVTA